MKKIICLLLVCAMIFSMALVGSAAGEGYTVTNGTISTIHGRFYLNVASKTVAGSGYLTIKYDPEKVTLLKQVKTQTGEDDEGNPIYSTTYEEYTSGNFAIAQSGCSFADQKADVSKGNVVVQWFNTSKVSAGANVFRLWFVAKDKSGDSFTESTFTLITNEAERAALGAEKGPIYVGTEAGDVTPTTEAMTWSYKNASVIPVTSVTVKPDYLETKIGLKTQLRVTCSPSGATNKSITWSSDNTKVATVDSNGYVTGKSAGTATITAKSNNGKKDKCVVTVKNKNKNIIDYAEYGYSFLNSGDSFGYPLGGLFYKIPKERYMQLGQSEASAKKMG